MWRILKYHFHEAVQSDSHVAVKVLILWLSLGYTGAVRGPLALRWLVQGVPRLFPKVSWDRLQAPVTLTDKRLQKMNEWMNVRGPLIEAEWLFISAFMGNLKLLIASNTISYQIFKCIVHIDKNDTDEFIHLLFLLIRTTAAHQWWVSSAPSGTSPPSMLEKQSQIVSAIVEIIFKKIKCNIW